MYRLKLKAFANADKSELSMIEVAHEILEEKGDTMAFVDLANEIQNYLGKSDEEIRERLPQFYTDLNVDGSFISLGDNVWGLRAWYPYDSVDEEVNHPEDEEEVPRRKKRKKVNAFLADVADDDDVIDYNDDDPEDDDFGDVEEEDETAAASDDDADDDDDDDSDDNFGNDEVAGGIGEEIGGIAPVDDDYGSGDIER